MTRKGWELFQMCAIQCNTLTVLAKNSGLQTFKIQRILCQPWRGSPNILDYIWLCCLANCIPFFLLPWLLWVTLDSFVKHTHNHTITQSHNHNTHASGGIHIRITTSFVHTWVCAMVNSCRAMTHSWLVNKGTAGKWGVFIACKCHVLSLLLCH